MNARRSATLAATLFVVTVQLPESAACRSSAATAIVAPAPAVPASSRNPSQEGKPSKLRTMLGYHRGHSGLSSCGSCGG